MMTQNRHKNQNYLRKLNNLDRNVVKNSHPHLGCELRIIMTMAVKLHSTFMWRKAFFNGKILSSSFFSFFSSFFRHPFIDAQEFTRGRAMKEERRSEKNERKHVIFLVLWMLKLINSHSMRACILLQIGTDIRCQRRIGEGKSGGGEKIDEPFYAFDSSYFRQRSLSISHTFQYKLLCCSSVGCSLN